MNDVFNIPALADLPLPPGLVLILGGLVAPFVPRLVRAALVLGLPVLAFLMVWSIPDGVSLSVTFLDQTLQLVRGDALSRFFATVFTIIAFLGGLFAINQNNKFELAAALVYGGGAIGVVFAGDLITVFIFWELMAIGSAVIVWSGGMEYSKGAGMRYLLVHFLGGVLLMTGIIFYIAETGSIAFNAMEANSIGTWLILAGFLVNAGAPPFSAWVADAYPEASYSGAVFLSAFTTKTAVYVILRGFAGEEVVLYVGLYMAYYGIIYALLENDMRRILAYSTVNQVGFMLVGVGMGTSMALNGAAGLAFAHVLFKALLLMSAGAVLYRTGKRKCTDLGGLFQSMPLTTLFGIVGALSISAFPYTSAFVTKAMINDAAAKEHLPIVWLLLTGGSAGVFLHAGIKFPWFVFFQKDSGMRPKDPPFNMGLAMLLLSMLCVGIGVFYQVLYDIMPYPVDYEPYTVPHVVNMLQLLFFSGLTFFLLLPLMKRTLTISLDFDWFYRVLGPAMLRGGARVVDAVAAGIGGVSNRVGGAVMDRLLLLGGPDGALSRSTVTGLTILIVTTALAVALALSLSH